MGMAKIGNWFRRQDIAYLGIQQRENSVYMIMVAEKEGEDYEIIWQNQITEDIAQEELLEKACLLADSSQQRNIICCLGLSQQDVYFYEKFFPELEAKELAQAVKLDFVSATAWQEPYWWSYTELTDGNMRIGGISKKAMAEKAKVCREFFDIVQGILICPGEVPDNVSLPEEWKSWPIGMQEAFYAAICGLHKQGLILGDIDTYKYQWHWLKAAKLLWGAVAGVGVFALALGWYTDYQAKEELAVKVHELHLLEDVAKRQEAIEADKEAIAGRNKLLANIHGSSKPAYSVLVRLGSSMEDGIWLTGVKLQEDGQVQLQGRAAAYNQIAQLLDKLSPKGEEEAQQGEQAMILDTADKGQNGMVDFQLKGRML